MKILIVADLTSDEHPEGRAAPVKLDHDNVGRVLATATPTRRLRYDFAGQTREAELSFDDEDAIELGSMARQIDLIAALQHVRRDLDKPELAADAAGAARQLLGLEPTAENQSDPVADASSDPDQAGDDFSRLLGTAAAQPDERAKPATSSVQNLINAIVQSEAKPAAGEAEQSLQSSIDEGIELIVRQIAADPGIRRVDRSWRAIRWLLAGLELQGDVELWLLPCRWSDLDADLDRSPQPSEAAFAQILAGSRSGADGRGFTYVLLDRQFGRDADDVLTLAQYARAAAANASTVLAGAERTLVSYAATADTGLPVPALEAAAQEQLLDAWSALRTDPAATFTGLAWPRLLVRHPYGRRGEHLDLAVEELSPRPDHESFAWMNPCYGVARLLAEGYEQAGEGFSPDRHNQLDDMPLAVFDDGTGDAIMPVAEAYLDENTALAVNNSGPMVFMSYRNRNSARVLRFQSIAEPARALRTS